MRKIIKIILIVTLTIVNYQLSMAQISINEDGSSPDVSAMLDVRSNGKGILIPRMTTAERTAISSPATGLLVYDTDFNTFWYYANSTWNNLSNTILADADADTKIQVEESSDDDIIRFDLGGTEYFKFNKGRIEVLNTGNSVFIGAGAGGNASYYINYNVFVGDSTGYSNTIGNYNVFQGAESGYANTTGSYNVFQGYRSGYGNITGNFNAFQGHQSGRSNTIGNGNSFQGYHSGFFNTEGNYNTFQGYQSGFSNTTGNQNVFLGYKAGYYETGDSKLYIDNSETTTPLIYGDFDSDSLQINGTLNIKGVYEFPIVDGTANQVLATDGNGVLSWTNTTILSDTDSDTKIEVEESSDDDIIRFDLGGTEFMRLDNGRIEILNTGRSVFIGEGAGVNDDFSDNQNIFIGDSSGYSNTAGGNNIFQGYQSGYSNTNGYSNGFQGYQSGYSNITGSFNMFRGYQSGYSNTTGHYNIFQGYQSGYNNTGGSSNIFQGFQSGFNNETGDKNISLGYESGYSNIEGDENISLGYQSGYSNTTGNKNISLGYQSGYSNTTGNKNVFLGHKAGYNETGSNKLYIDNSNTTTPLIYGDFDSDSLQINGTLNIKGLYEFPIVDGTANQVLATDGSGSLTWSDLNSGVISESGVTHSTNNTDDFVIGADSLNYSGSGDDYKMFFDQSIGAFRVGRIKNTNWDDTNLGAYSFATGTSTMALGNNSAAFGFETIALGTHSFAGGNKSEAIGNISFAFGREVTAPSYGEIAIGLYNTTYTPNDSTDFDAADRLFVIGNGEGNNDRSDAMIVYKNGNAWIQGNLTVDATNYPSDIRLKENITASQYGLKDVLNIQVRDYEFKKDVTNHLHTGFLAQQLHTVFPHAVHKGGEDEKTNPWSVDYASLTPLLVKGMQEQQVIIEGFVIKDKRQQVEIEKLKVEISKIQQLEQQNAEMKAMLEQIQTQLEANTNSNQSAE